MLLYYHHLYLEVQQLLDKLERLGGQSLFVFLLLSLPHDKLLGH